MSRRNICYQSGNSTRRGYEQDPAQKGSVQKAQSGCCDDDGRTAQTYLGLLEAEAKIRVEDLADRLDVSQVTMRKDLDILEKQGLLERIHGSAVFSQRNRLNISFLEEFRRTRSQKG